MKTENDSRFMKLPVVSLLKKVLLLSFLFVFLLQGSWAQSNIKGYRVLFGDWSTLDLARNQKEKINQLMPNYFVQYLETNAKAYIVDNKTTYSVYLGDYPNLGEARHMIWYIGRGNRVYNCRGQVEPIPIPIPPIESITEIAQEVYNQATIFMKEEDYPRACAYFAAYIHNYPEDENYYPALMGLGLADSKLNNRSDAIQTFKKVAASQSPLAKEALLRLGYSYLAIYDLHDAFLTFQSIIEKYPGSSQAKESQERLDAFEGKNAEDALYKSAMLLIAGQEYNNAIYLLDKFISQYPKSTRLDEAYLRKANCRLKLHDKEGAFTDYKQLLKFPKSKFVKDACGELCKLADQLADYTETTSYLYEAADAISKSSCLDTSNQELGGLCQTFRCNMLYFGVLKANQISSAGFHQSPLSIQSSCWDAIALCRDIPHKYPHANRFDLARTKLYEVELLDWLSWNANLDVNEVIRAAKQLITDYPEQRQVLCETYCILGWAQGYIGESDNAFQTNQYIVDHFTAKDNISPMDDLIAIALWRQVGNLQSQKKYEETRPILQEIIRNHYQSNNVVFAKRELQKLNKKD